VLILSRKPGEAIIIEGGIRVVVISCDRKSVRLGIEAPPSVSILRSEIVIAIAEENQRAADTADASEWLSGLGEPPEEPK
jgi:carbon storage regulator